MASNVDVDNEAAINQELDNSIARVANLHYGEGDTAKVRRAAMHVRGRDTSM